MNSMKNSIYIDNIKCILENGQLEQLVQGGYYLQRKHRWVEVLKNDELVLSIQEGDSLYDEAVEAFSMLASDKAKHIYKRHVLAAEKEEYDRARAESMRNSIIHAMQLGMSKEQILEEIKGLPIYVGGYLCVETCSGNVVVNFNNRYDKHGKLVEDYTPYRKILEIW